MCEDIELNTAPWVGAKDAQELVEASREFFSEDNIVLIKSSNGTGGISLGGIRKIQTHDEIVADIVHIEKLNAPLVAEKMIDKVAEVSIHWEMHDDGEVILVFTI